VRKDIILIIMKQLSMLVHYHLVWMADLHVRVFKKNILCYVPFVTILSKYFQCIIVLIWRRGNINRVILPRLCTITFLCCHSCTITLSKWRHFSHTLLYGSLIWDKLCSPETTEINDVKKQYGSKVWLHPTSCSQYK